MAKSQIKVLRTKDDFIRWLAQHLLERPPVIITSQVVSSATGVESFRVRMANRLEGKDQHSGSAGDAVLFD